MPVVEPVCGPWLVRSGALKSSLVLAVLADAEAEYLKSPPYSASTPRPPFVVVQLHGRNLDDDVVAARELCRQLSLGDAIPRTRKSSVEHYLRFVMESLREGSAANVPVFIVLHDFDLFAKRAKQTLLYNLLDITQSSKYQVCIIGVTTRLDATDLLEKRLRSRFSQRQILLGQPDIATFSAFASEALSVDPAAALEGLSDVGSRDVKAGVEQWNQASASALLSPAVQKLV